MLGLWVRTMVPQKELWSLMILLANRSLCVSGLARESVVLVSFNVSKSTRKYYPDHSTHLSWSEQTYVRA